jgi:hypothetical protein
MSVQKEQNLALLLESYRKLSKEAMNKCMLDTGLYWADKVASISGKNWFLIGRIYIVLLESHLGSMEDWYLVGKMYYMLQQYHSTISIFVQYGLIDKSPLARYLAAKCAVGIIDQNMAFYIIQSTW